MLLHICQVLQQMAGHFTCHLHRLYGRQSTLFEEEADKTKGYSAHALCSFILKEAVDLASH